MDNEPVEIIPNLYLGSKHAYYNREIMNRFHVKYIVNCGRQDIIFPDVRLFVMLWLSRTSPTFMCILKIMRIVIFSPVFIIPSILLAKGSQTDLYLYIGVFSNGFWTLVHTEEAVLQLQ